MLPTILAAVVLSQPSSVEYSRTYCNGYVTGIERFINNHLTKTGYANARLRKTISVQLSRRIVAEAKRFRLDPIVMATISWIESDYRPFLRGTYRGVGRRQNEIGVWQVIPWGWGTRSANKTIVGCRPGRFLPRYAWPRYFRYYKWKRCDYPDVGKQRTRLGSFSIAEMRSFYIGTFIAAHIMRKGIDAKKKLGLRIPHMKWLPQWIINNPNVNRIKLMRYGSYNWGSKWYPRGPYAKKLFHRYTIVRRKVCGK
jgi:hypothetical protein